MRRKLMWSIGTLLLLLAVPLTASAHVKWFADFSFEDPPLPLSEALTPTFLGLAAFSAFVIGALVLVDRRLTDVTFYKRINEWLAGYRDYSTQILRIGVGATMLLNWQADALLMPELVIEDQGWIGWLQFIVALLVIFPTTTPAAGVGLFILYGLGVVEYGIFHMLDYIFVLGIAYWLIVRYFDNPMIYGAAIPVLYATVGFSLCWVALEKVIYPQWTEYILQNNPQLTLGFPVDFFRVAAAFVEFALGYLLIINLLQRPLGLAITLVFFTTTLVFGKVEIIGHTMIHAALLVFIIEGPGEVYRAPITFHKRLPMRIAFASVNFLLLLVLVTVPYSWGAEQVHERETAEQAFVIDPMVLELNDSGVVFE